MWFTGGEKELPELKYHVFVRMLPEMYPIKYQANRCSKPPQEN